MGLSYRLGTKSLFERPKEDTKKPKRVIFLSLEGTKTEVQYFRYVEKYREELEIDALVHIEVLRRNDTNSDIDSVFSLLEEYIDFRQKKQFQKEIESMKLSEFDTDFIKDYLQDPNKLELKTKNKFEATLKQEHIDLLYLDFLSKYQGEDDKFGIVIDRDCKSHPLEHMKQIIEKCKEKDYLCFITNPCFEFWLMLHVSDVSVEYASKLNEILDNDLDHKKNTYISNLLYEKTKSRKAIQLKTFETYYLPNIDLAIKRAKSFASFDELLTKVGTNLWQLFDLLRNV